MKRTLGLLLGSLIVSLSFAIWGEERVLSMTPQMAKIGESIVITYNSGAKNALLRECKTMIAEVLLLRVS